MKPGIPSSLLIPCTLAAVLCAAAADEKVDLKVVHQIRTEALQSSQVMNHLFRLTDVFGARLTGSPGFAAAAQWAQLTAASWGLENPHLEPWTNFGRGWSYSRLDLHMTKPVYAPLHSVPLAWCGGTDGLVEGPALPTPLLHEDEESSPWWELDLATIGERLQEYRQRWQGKLQGKVVLLNQPRSFTLATNSLAKRLQDQDLSGLAEAPEPAPSEPINWVPDRLPRDARKRAALLDNLPLEIQADRWLRWDQAFEKVLAFLQKERVLAVLTTDARGPGGLLFAEAAGVPRSHSALPPVLVVVPEQYNRLWRLAEQGLPVAVALDLTVSLIEAPVTVNVVAEIPGTTRPDEVVMIGGHLDSWHAGTGATDNAAGCAVILEAMRILKSLGLKMDRTVRMALWSGEEQGLFGSRAYVREHFGDPITLQLKPEHAKLAAYFNVDNGSGKIRGVHLQGNDMVRPIFEAWLAPFKDLGADTLTIRNTDGTDHLSFDSVGLPGFQFIQDPLDYGSRTHHSNADVYDHVQPGDLMQASAVVAAFTYQAATRPEPLPRKTLPSPLPPKPSPAEGFVPLFNGKDLSGWTVRQQDNRDWQVVDEVIDCDPHPGPGDRNLWTTDLYRDFELIVDWRIKESLYVNRSGRVIQAGGSYKLDGSGHPIAIPVPNTDSGIFLRGEHKSQVNIWCWPIGSGEVWGYRTDPALSPLQHSAVTPRFRADRPIGEWNTFHIILKNDRLSVSLNGKQVIENAQLPGIPAEGPIALQQHGDRQDGEWGASFVQFRNIWLKKL